jgi:hypothetical protein
MVGFAAFLSKEKQRGMPLRVSTMYLDHLLLMYVCVRILALGVCSENKRRLSLSLRLHGTALNPSASENKWRKEKGSSL